jgi:hypothetical protein
MSYAPAFVSDGTSTSEYYGLLTNWFEPNSAILVSGAFGYQRDMTNNERLSDQRRKKDLEINSSRGGAIGNQREITNIVSFSGQRRKKELEIISQLITKCTLRGAVFVYAISATTAAHATNLVQMLEPNIPLPKLSVDSDGGLLFVWESGRNSVLATVTDSKIDLTSRAGTLDAQFISDVPLKGLTTPPELTRCLESL